MNKKYKYSLELYGSFVDGINSLTLNFSKEDNQTIFLESFDDILNICEVIADDSKNVTKYFNSNYISKYEDFFVDEKIPDKASTLLELIFKNSNVDYINNKNWNTLKLLYNIKTPELETSSIALNGEPVNINTFTSDVSIDYKKLELFTEQVNGLDIVFSYRYECNNSKELLIATIDTIFRNKESAVIKRCENCQKLYIPKKLDAKYCDRISPQMDDKTCKQAVDSEKKNEALSNPMQKLIKNVDQNLLGIYRNSNSKEDRETLQSFRRQNLLKRKEYLNGSITPDEYEKWLRSFYKRNKGDIS